MTILSWDTEDGNSNRASYTFILHLLDENDNAPTFDKSSYELNIFENNKPNHLIHQFKAVDLDQAANGEIFYSLEFNNSKQDNVVYIEPATGVLRASVKFDREERGEYEFLVVARDNNPDPKQQLITKVKCLLKIVDLNDNQPSIEYNNSVGLFREATSNKTHLILNIDENISTMTQVAQFACEDKDHDQNGQTKLFIQEKKSSFPYGKNMLQNVLFIGSSLNSLNSDANSLPFKLGNDGKLFVTKRLDRETLSNYEMVVVCQDHAKAPLNATLNVIVNVNDVNDNCPRSLNQTQWNSEAYVEAKTRFVNKAVIKKSKEARFNLFMLDYADADINQNSQLTFELLSHADIFRLEVIKMQPIKSINSSIYTLFIQLNLNYSANSDMNSVFVDLLKPGHYLIKVKISDNGYPTCIKTDMFRFYLGNEATKTQQDLTNKLSMIAKSSHEFGPVDDFINDKDDSATDMNNELSANRISMNQALSRGSNLTLFKFPTQPRSFLNRFAKDDYIVLISLIALLVIASALLSIVGCVYFIKNYPDKSGKSRGAKLSSSDLLKVKNYRGIELNESSNNSSSSSSSASSNSNEEDESQAEMNKLLEHDAAVNRFSLSFKSCTEQSQSADSVMSSLTFARDMTMSNTSNNSHTELVQLPPNANYITYSTDTCNKKKHSSFKPKSIYMEDYVDYTKVNRKT